MSQPRKGGFTLCEVMISLGIFTFALTALLGLLPTALVTGRSAIDEATASHVAEQVAADIRRTGQAGEDWLVDGLGRRVGPAESPVYRARIRLMDGETSRLKRLTITLSREGQADTPRSFASLVFVEET